CQNDYSYPLTF
nr:immunoglobulin light chain junction region [Mus musculus]